MTNEIIEFYREHLKPIIQKMLLKTNYQGQGKVDYEEFGRDFDELLDLAIIGMQSNSDGDCISRAEAIKAIRNYNVTIEVGRAIGKSQLADIVDSINKVQEKMISDLPSVQPIRTKGDMSVIEDIREEVYQMTLPGTYISKGNTWESIRYGVKLALEIIDKHISESEDKE